MRTLVLALTITAALALSGTRANAYYYGWYPWCAWLVTGIEAGSCAYVTLAQCIATVRGVGGYCGINPYPPPPGAVQWRPKRRYAR